MFPSRDDKVLRVVDACVCVCAVLKSLATAKLTDESSKILQHFVRCRIPTLLNPLPNSIMISVVMYVGTMYTIHSIHKFQISREKS